MRDFEALGRMFSRFSKFVERAAVAFEQVLDRLAEALGSRAPSRDIDRIILAEEERRHRARARNREAIAEQARAIRRASHRVPLEHIHGFAQRLPRFTRVHR